jgi:hypothetical protein
VAEDCVGLPLSREDAAGEGQLVVDRRGR